MFSNVRYIGRSDGWFLDHPASVNYVEDTLLSIANSSLSAEKTDKSSVPYILFYDNYYAKLYIAWFNCKTHFLSVKNLFAIWNLLSYATWASNENNLQE